MNQENEVQREVLKMPMALRVVRILMIIYAVIILVDLIGIWPRVPLVALAMLALWSWFLLSMAKAIKARKNGPRYVMAGISAISLFGCICMFPCIFSIIDGGIPPGYVEWAFVSVVLAVFCWIPTAILFLPSSNDWFATKKQYGNKEV